MNGSKLEELMNAKSITKQQLADAVGVSRTMIIYIIKGFKDPSIKTLKRIADYFEVSTDELI